MLCQLVCVDRRYQRMNCFNIRELQGILKRKFFTDLVNTSDSHKAVESTLIGMRHKNNMSNILLYDQSLFYNFDLTNTSKSKTYNFNPGYVYDYAGLSLLPDVNFFKNPTNINLTNYYIIFAALLKDFLNYVYMPNLLTFNTVFSSLTYVKCIVVNTLYINIPNFLNLPSYTVYTAKTPNTDSVGTTYNSSNINYSTFSTLSPLSFSEDSSS
jgi:hypothetical protein